MNTAVEAAATLDPAAIDCVVIGCSAGGIEALTVLLPALPAGCRATVLVVVHLPADRPSLLAEIFAPKCRLPVLEAEDKLPLAPGTLVFAPPDYHLLVDAGPSLALSADEPVNFSRPSIDVLFDSAVDAFGPRLMGIVLSGANGDGAAGLAAIGAAGGVTVVQDPAEARASMMPAEAVRRASPRHVLPLAGIAALLRQLSPTPGAPR